MAKIIDKTTHNYPYLDKDVEIYTLENGHKIVIAKKEGDLVNVSTWVKTGSIHENDEISGISHFLEHLMFKGTPTHAAGDFDRILEAKGAIVNAATWKDYTFYYVTLPKGKNNEDFELVVDLHADMMLNPTLPEFEIGPTFDVNGDAPEKRERYVVIEEIRMREDQPWTKVYNALNKAMYKVHPYKRDVIGTADIISQVPRDTIMEYYRNWYTPENMTTIIVGDFEGDEIIDFVADKFKFEGERPCKRPTWDKESEQTKMQYVENTANINTGFAIFGYHGATAGDLRDTILLDIVGIILGEGKSSRLQKHLIEEPKEPIFNMIGADQYHFRDGNTFFIQANFQPEHLEKAIEGLEKEIAGMSKITQDELKKAKKKLKIRFADTAETVSEIGETIGYYLTVCEDLGLFSDYMKTMEAITVSDVEAAVRKYLDINKATISVLMPEGEQK
jgi:zinc protease